MPNKTSRNALILLGGVAVALAGVSAATAQRFVWPPTRSAPASEPSAATNQPTAPVEKPAWEAIQPAPAAVATPAAMPAMRLAPVAQGQSATIDWRILENPQGPHTALFFDPVRQVFAVYHVDSASGQIMLKSVRNVSADLRLDQFNSSNPAPKDIQSMLDEAR